jgi:hypothetical protein
MPRLTRRRLVGALSYINAFLLIGMSIFVASDFIQTMSERRALVPDETAIVAEESMGQGQSTLERIETVYPEDTL